MKIIGKILFFSATDGTGIIITQNKMKVNFNIQEWDDFDTMPSLGLEVEITYKNKKIVSITTIYHNLDDIEIETPNKLKFKDRKNLENKPDKEDGEDIISPEENQIKDENKPELKYKSKLKNELGDRKDKVTMTMTLNRAVENYFNGVEDNIKKRASYKKVDGRLEYVLIRRFLWTTFNNLSEIDLRIITPKTKALSDDLQVMSDLYDDFTKKVKFPHIAYEEVFLTCQAEYLKMKEGTLKIYARLNQLRNSEVHIAASLKVKKQEVTRYKGTAKFEELKKEYRLINGNYSDVVHEKAELDERYKYDMLLLNDFEKEFKNDFNAAFRDTATQYKKKILDVLNAQAYLLDDVLWAQAKLSKILILNFQEAGIDGGYNTKTYLKYYLDSFDTDKVTDETRKLYELYDYLSSINNHIVIVSGSVPEAMAYESYVKKVNEEYHVKSFIDEKTALKWAIRHNVKILIVEEDLVNMKVEPFLRYYMKNIMVIPTIIVLGNAEKSDEYKIHTQMSNGISPKAVAQIVKELTEAI